VPGRATSRRRRELPLPNFTPGATKPFADQGLYRISSETSSMRCSGGISQIARDQRRTSSCRAISRGRPPIGRGKGTQSSPRRHRLQSVFSPGRGGIFQASRAEAMPVIGARSLNNSTARTDYGVTPQVIQIEQGWKWTGHWSNGRREHQRIWVSVDQPRRRREAAVAGPRPGDGASIRTISAETIRPSCGRSPITARSSGGRDTAEARQIPGSQWRRVSFAGRPTGGLAVGSKFR